MSDTERLDRIPPPLDPIVAEIIAEAALVPRLDPSTTPLDRQRRAVELAAVAWNDPPYPCARVEALTLATPAGQRCSSSPEPEWAALANTSRCVRSENSSPST